MYFHIDEAGNTGNNMFDIAQPCLSYGVLSSLRNTDVLCSNIHKDILHVIADKQIHANQLGFGGLVKISPHLIKIQEKMKFDFDYYFIQKPDFVIVMFFDAVFDQGINPAVKWEFYWTPLRYLVIYHLVELFDEPLLREAWRLCIAKKIDNYSDDIITLLTKLKIRAKHTTRDARLKEIIIDAMNYGIANPMALDFGQPDEKMVSPNAVGFQFVANCIARRVKSKRLKKASSIIIDRQQQFNKAQITTHEHQALITEGLKKSSPKERNMYIKHPLHATTDKFDIVNRGLIDQELTISKSIDSIGLQIVDVYLWMANKIISGHDLPKELGHLWSLFQKRCTIDGISIVGMMERFERFEEMLPSCETLTEEQFNQNQLSIEKHREKVRSLR